MFHTKLFAAAALGAAVVAGSTLAGATGLSPAVSGPHGSVVKAQAGGGGTMGEGSGGLSGSTPGSPGVGQRGSSPSTRPGTTTQPGQSSALPSDPRSGAGAPGAPAPGTGGTGMYTAPGSPTAPGAPTTPRTAPGTSR